MTSAVTRVLVTGGAGLLAGWLFRTAPDAIVLHATRRHTPVHGPPSSPVDLAEAAATTELVGRLGPDVVVHTAYGKADGERDILGASRNVAEAAAATGAAMVHLSSDVVFDGEHAPYGEQDTPAPVSDYGHWKAAAEAAVTAACPDAAIVRTSLIMSSDPPDHVTAELAGALRRGDRPLLYHDELRCPVGGADLAAAIWELLGLPRGERAGLWHLAGPEAVSRSTLGYLVAAALGHPPTFDTAANSAAPEPRPRDLRLLTSRADEVLQTRLRPVGEVVARPR